MWWWMGGHKVWQWDARSLNKPCLEKETLEWGPIMRKMNPQIGADNFFIDSCPDPDNFYRSMYRQSRKPTQAGFLQDMKYQIEINKHHYYPIFTAALWSRGYFQLRLTTFSSRPMEVSGASVHLPQSQGRQPSASPLPSSPHQQCWGCPPQGKTAQETLRLPLLSLSVRKQQL